MDLSKHLREECIYVGGKASDKTDVLKAIAHLAKNSPILKHVSEEEILDGLQERERLGSTGFAPEIAIPHCRLKHVSNFVVGILTVPEGVDFEAFDGAPTKLFVFIIAPTARQNEHVQILSNISNVLRFPEHVQELLARQTVGAIREYFLRQLATENDIPSHENTYQLLSVVIQHKAVFHDILTIFAEIQAGYVSVLEANHAREYLYALPMFALFWNEDRHDFQRIILAVLPKTYVNETLRKLNLIMEDMETESGMLVWLQDIAYISGSLDL